jgi:hypothetical protein
MDKVILALKLPVPVAYADSLIALARHYDPDAHVMTQNGFLVCFHWVFGDPVPVE